MNINEKMEYWLDIAKDDLNTARVLLENKIYLQSCFYCQQVIEKALKAYYWFVKQDEPPYTHSLHKLAIGSGIYEKFSEDQKDFIDILMPFNIEARYPIDKQRLSSELDNARGKMIFNKTKELQEWIVQFLKK